MAKEKRTRIISLILAGILAFPLSGCKSGEAKGDTPASDAKEEAVLEDQTSLENSDTASLKEGQEDASDIEEEDFSFEAFENLQFVFSSGAGGWATTMMIDADGSFSGQFYDSDLGITGDNYPNGTMYMSNFSGQFTQPVKVNDYTYSMQIREITYAQELGSEEIKDGMLYCYTDVYGLNDAENILIYLPGTPLEELSEEVRSWFGCFALSDTEDTELPFYALNNEAMQLGFSSYNIVDNIREIIAGTQEQADFLMDSLENDALDQSGLNEKSLELYELWDGALNQLWKVLKQTKETEEMKTLTIEEREWISAKEQAVYEAGQEVEGGSMQPMVMNLKAAELTRERLYELLELL